MILAPTIGVTQVKELVLQNLWHYQRRHNGKDRSKRWTFALTPKHPLFPLFAQAIVSLQMDGLVGMAPNHQYFLTDYGYHYCESSVDELLPENRFFDDYGISPEENGNGQGGTKTS